MFETILVPLDGSALAERALPIARSLSRALKAHLILVQAIPTESNAPGDLAAAQAYLDERAAHPTDSEPCEAIVVEGDPASTILDQTTRQKADLIVMSTHGRSGLGRWIYGSVADEVMRGASVPVLVVPSIGAIAWPNDRALRIVIPLDGSELAESILGPVGDLAHGLCAELVLVRAIEPHPYAYGDPSIYYAFDPTAEMEAAREYLEKIARRLSAQGQTVSFKDDFGFAAQTIVELAREQHAGIIAMATHGSSGLTRLVLGSVTTGVVQQAAVPVLIIRPALIE